MSDIVRKKNTGEPGNKGEFGRRGKPASGVSLAEPAAPAADTVAASRVAALLGCDDEWDGSADYLDDIAALVAATGRPHPGDTAAAEYEHALREWASRNPAPADAVAAADYRCVTRIASALGTAEEWDSEHLDEVADAVAQTGRPHPGRLGDTRYEDLLARWERDQRVPGADPYGTWAAVRDSGHDPMQEVLRAVGDRGWVTGRLAGLTGPDVDRLHREVMDPAGRRVEDHLREVWGDGAAVGEVSREESLEAKRAVAEAAEEAGLPVAAAVLIDRYERGGVPVHALAGLTAEGVTGVYEQHIGPAVDRIENDLENG